MTYLLIYISVILGLYKVSLVYDPDYFFHFFTGKYILDNKTIPNSDIFSWYDVKATWYTPSWLFDVISYLLKDKIIILLPILFAILIFILAKTFFKDQNKMDILKFVAFAIMIVLLLPFIQHRPTIFSFLFFAYTIHILFEYIYEKNKTFNRLIYTLPIVQVLWVNLHGASSSLMYILIITVLIINVLKPFSFKNIQHKRLDKEKLKKTFILLILVLLASLINPNTYKFFIFIFTNFGNSNLFSGITELQSPNFGSYFRVILLLFPLFMLGFTFLISEDKFNLTDLIITSMFICLYFRAVRFYPYLIIIIIYMLGKYFKLNLITIDFSRIKKGSHKLLIHITMLIIISVVGITVYKDYDKHKNYINSYKQNDKLENYINTARFFSGDIINKLIELKPARLGNSFNYGGFLSYMFLSDNSDSKVFINGLAEIYSYSDIFEDEAILFNLFDNPEDILQKYNFDYIVVSISDALYWYLKKSPDYEMILKDETGAIFKNLNVGDNNG